MKSKILSTALAFALLTLVPALARSQVCNDGLDNDADGLTDWPADPDCASAVDTAELKPAFAGSLGTLTSSRGVYVSGNYAYVAEDVNGLRIVDVSNVASPSLTGTYNTLGSSRDVIVRGNYAYVSDNDNGLVIVDVSNPAAPTLAGSYGLPFYAYETNLIGDLAYIANQNAGLQILDISNPASPSFVGTYNTAGSAFGIFVRGSYAYIGDFGAGLQIIDVSTPATPTLAGTYDTTGNAREVSVSGDHAYVADAGVGLQIINVLDAGTPTLTATYSASLVNWAVDVIGPYAVVGLGSTGADMVNISDPANPILAASFSVAGTIQGIHVKGGYAYVAEWGGGLEIFDLNFTDSDGDGMPNWYELASGCLMANTADGGGDPDGDLVTSLTEYNDGTDPGVMDDADGDGMPDWWEALHGCLMAATADGDLDPDSDVMTSLEEYTYSDQLDPCYHDTDGDGLAEVDEINTHGTDPLLFDTDGGGEGDGSEIYRGADPFSPGDDLHCNLFVVGATGSDTTGDRIIVRPYRTIGAAVAMALNGDTICVAGGFYDETSILLNKDLQILGGFNPPTWERNVPVFRTVVDGQPGLDLFVADFGDDVLIDGLVIQNANVAVANQVSALTTLSNNIIRDNNYGLWIEGWDFDDPWVRMSNNLVNANAYGIFGWYVGYGTASLESTNNTFASNTGYGLWFWGSSTTIRNDIIADNVDDLMLNATATVDYTDVEDGYTGPGANNISVDPQFWDPAVTDHGLQPGSSCIDAGDPAAQYNDPDASRNDMGFTGGPNSAFFDTDYDGIPDTWETYYGFNPLSAADAVLDGDSDGLTNRYEYFHFADPGNPDTDGDGLDDAWEAAYASCGGFKAYLDETSRLTDDDDTDGLTTLAEYNNGADPCNPDTDADTLSDGDEVNIHGTDPTLADTDGDGMEDGWEVNTGGGCGLDPLSGDSTGNPDGDAYDNLAEFQNNGDPCATTACSDGLDNDLDNWLDLSDPGCDDLADVDERGPAEECDNGIDDDSDGFFDFPDDPDCDNLFDIEEKVALTGVYDTDDTYYYGVAVDGNYAYMMGTWTTGLQIIDVSDPLNTFLVGEHDVEARDAQIIGNYAYVADTGGLKVLDVTDPANPTQEAAKYFSGGGNDIKISGSYAYIAGTSSGLVILDISNIGVTQITEAGRYNGMGTSQGVDIVGTTAYLADGDSGLIILDVSDPANPTPLGNCDTPDARAVAVSGNYAYVADWDSGIQVIDVSNPASPAVVGSYDTSWAATDVVVEGDYAYVARHYGGIQIIDVSNPASPTPVGNYFTPMLSWSLEKSGDLLYVADWHAGLQIIDASDPANPILAGAHDDIDQALGVHTVGDYAYVAFDQYGLQVFDVSDPIHPALVGGYDTNQAQDLDIVGNYAYVADIGRLHIIDISDPTNPLMGGSVSMMGVRDVSVQGNYAYAAVGGEGLQIVDVSVPASPSIVGTYDTAGSPYNVFVSGNYAYVADWYNGLVIVDVSNPAAPTLAGSTVTGFAARGVFVVGNYAYVAAYTSGFQVVDVSDPANPVVVRTAFGSARLYDVYVSGNKAYAADYDYGLRIYDISDPLNAFQYDNYGTGEDPQDVYVAGDYAYLADGFGGLKIFDLRGDSEDDGVSDWYEIDHQECLDAYTTDYNIDSDNDTLSNYEEFLARTDPCERDTDNDGIWDVYEINNYNTDPNDWDTDNDGLSDGYETPKPCLDPLVGTTIDDLDGDLLTNVEEYNLGTNACYTDSDSDGLDDGLEVAVGADPTDWDSDDDGINDGDEVLLYGSNPSLADTDGDGISDYDEIFTYLTDPADPDSDGDGLTDLSEIHVTATDPLDPDTDDDGIPDGEEAGSSLSDTDGDGMPNSWEDGNTCTDVAAGDSTADPDGDGLTNLEEYNAGTDPCAADTDSDGLDDDYEINTSGTNPALPDTDGDGLIDGDELNVHSTNPLDEDSDNDGYSDGAEIAAGTLPNDPGSYPAPPAHLINYQGRLTDNVGVAVSDTVDMTFRIFEVLAGGTELWSETQNDVVVMAGIYEVLLGGVTELDASVFNNSPLYLEVEVNGEALSPRARITSVPFAVKAEELMGGRLEMDSRTLSISTPASIVTMRVSFKRAFSAPPLVMVNLGGILGVWSVDNITSGRWTTSPPTGST
jgi:hypothetical protein